MTSPRFNILQPRRESGATSGLGGITGHTGALDLNSSGRPVSSDPSSDLSARPSGSRRPSGASGQSSGAHSFSQHSNYSNHPPHSPASVSSSSTHPWMTPREAIDSAPWGSSPQAGSSHLPSASDSQTIQKHSNLPRIATPGSDPREGASEEAGGGPRSAPMSSPLAAHNVPFIQPPHRAASSPDPRSASSPITSPVDSRASHSGSLPFAPSASHMGPSDHHAQAGHPLSPWTAAYSASPGSATASATDLSATPRRSETPTSITSSTHGASSGGAVVMGGIASQRNQQTRRSVSVTYCAKCGLAVKGQFVRALHQVYHLECFRCRDCDKVVAQKFFPVDDGEHGQYPLCERDYFARLDLICAKCDQALRSSYITACGDKFHVEHFSCSVCDTVFGATDSYYEHNGKVYCHYHYSISFANKCVGCETAILKQFVEINRNGRDECWHPECYMIHKFWNVRLTSRNFTTPSSTTPTSSTHSLLEMSSPTTQMTSPISGSPNPGWGSDMTAEELKERQITMELKVSQIWLVLSGFEESSAACIGEMLRVVNERQLLDVILLAEKFILHVETLFAVIDDLEAQFALAGVKGMSHAREAKQLCRKLVNFFSMLSQISPHGGAIPNMQELLTQVTQLAHYLKILIRIALTGAIKLDREQINPKAMTNALARLHLLSLDNADPALPKRGDHPGPSGPIDAWTGNETPEDMAKRSFDSLTRHPEGFIPSTRRVAYGYRSLAVEATHETTLRGPQTDDFVPNDGCARCNGSIEDDCVRLGMFNRWHSSCVECRNCGDKASNTETVGSPIMRTVSTDDKSLDGTTLDGEGSEHPAPKGRRAPPRVGDFNYEPPARQWGPAETMWCNLHRTATSVPGFQTVSRLEQFAFLLHVALRKLYLHFREHHNIPSGMYMSKTTANLAAGTRTEPQDVKRVKSVTLDRKLSSTARLPQRSTVVESPAGKMADENGQVVAAREAVPTPIIISSANDGPQSATVDVIRPAFARNNTSVRIISEALPDAASESVVAELQASTAGTLTLPSERRAQEDDAITLSDIPMLANRSIHARSPLEGLPLMAKLTPLQSLIVRHFALIQLSKTGIGHLVDMDELIEILDSRKNQWWNKLFKGNAKKDQKKKGIFGVPLEIVVDRTGSDSQQGASNALLRVPEFIEEIISTMRQMDMAVEGIFRKNGNIRRLQQMAENLDKDYGSVSLSDENPVQLAALLKRFLREMPDPLLTFRLHKLFCAAATLPNSEDRKRCMHLLVTLLPRVNRDTMEVLFVFLRWVASFSYRDEETGSRMDLQNLATVITPSILYARGGNAARDESFVGIQAVQQLLEGQDDFFRVPLELHFVIQENVAHIFTKEIDLPPKEIHKHCAKYLQARGNVRPPPSMPPPSGGMMRERPPDLRLSAYRSDGGNSSGDVTNAAASLRAASSPQNNSRPTSWGPHPPGPGTPTGENPPRSLVMPTPQINGQPAATSPGFPNFPHSHHQVPSPSGWRGPFQGAASNGSRQSSRGSAPSSPGVAEERRSTQMERDRSRDRAWTPSEQRDRQ